MQRLQESPGSLHKYIYTHTPVYKHPPTPTLRMFAMILLWKIQRQILECKVYLHFSFQAFLDGQFSDKLETKCE